jgi:hypothetical protein
MLRQPRLFSADARLPVLHALRLDLPQEHLTQGT